MIFAVYKASSLYHSNTIDIGANAVLTSRYYINRSNVTGADRSFNPTITLPQKRGKTGELVVLLPMIRRVSLTQILERQTAKSGFRNYPGEQLRSACVNLR